MIRTLCRIGCTIVYIGAGIIAEAGVSGQILFASKAYGEIAVLHASSIPPTDELSYRFSLLVDRGMIRPGDSVNSYLSGLVQVLQGDAKQTIPAYVVYTPEINALSAPGKYILITTGLLAMLKSESQLAMILAHELGHHALNHLPHTSESGSHSNKTDTATLEKAVPGAIESYSFSISQELSADRFAFEIMKKNSIAIDTQVWDILAYDLPFINDWYWDNILYPLDKLCIPIVAGFSSERSRIKWDPVDSERYPSVQRRKAQFAQLTNTKEVEDFQFSPKTFDDVRTRSQIDLCRTLVENQRYALALYNAQSLLRKNPNNLYLQKLSAYALYALAKYAAGGRFWDVHTPYEEIPGLARSLFVSIERATDEQLWMLATRYCLMVCNKMPADETLKLTIKDLMDHSPIGLEPRDDISHEDSSGCLKNFFLDSLVQRYLEGAYKEKEEVQPLKLSEKQQLVFVSPNFVVIDERLSLQPLFPASYEYTLRLAGLLKKHAKTVGVKAKIIQQEAGTIDFSDLQILSLWASQKRATIEIEPVNLYHSEVQPLLDKYPAAKFIWVEGGVRTRVRPSRKMVLVAGLLLPVMLPYSVYYFSTPRHTTIIQAELYDIRTGKLLKHLPFEVQLRNREDVLNSIIYDLVVQMHNL